MSKTPGRFKTMSLEQFAASFRADFRFGPLNIMVLISLCLLGLVVHLSMYTFQMQAVITMVAVALGLSVIFRLLQVWESVIIFTAAAALGVYIHHTPESTVLVISVAVAGFVAPCVQMAYQWERALLLRFGKFRGLRGSGLFLVWPVIDKVANYVDQRIRVTDFSAETTLTKDTVPVNVDAIAFWMVWDAEKSEL